MIGNPPKTYFEALDIYLKHAIEACDKIIEFIRELRKETREHENN